MDLFNKCLEVEKAHLLVVNNLNQLQSQQLLLEVKLRSFEESVTKVKTISVFSKI